MAKTHVFSTPPEPVWDAHCDGDRLLTICNAVNATPGMFSLRYGVSSPISAPGNSMVYHGYIGNYLPKSLSTQDLKRLGFVELYKNVYLSPDDMVAVSFVGTPGEKESSKWDVSSLRRGTKDYRYRSDIGGGYIDSYLEEIGQNQPFFTSTRERKRWERDMIERSSRDNTIWSSQVYVADNIHSWVCILNILIERHWKNREGKKYNHPVKAALKSLEMLMEGDGRYNEDRTILQYVQQEAAYYDASLVVGVFGEHVHIQVNHFFGDQVIDALAWE